MSRVLLKTSGRTGSHLLLDEYEQKGFRVYFTATDKPNALYEYDITESFFPFDFNFIVQCHLKQLPARTEDWDLIINNRGDIVSQISSSIISHSTDVWHGVADIKEKIIADKQIIKREVIRHVSYNTYMKNVAKYFPWKSVSTISMEQILEKDWSHIEHKKAIKYEDAIDDYANVRKYIANVYARFYDLGIAYGKTEFDIMHGEVYDIQ